MRYALFAGADYYPAGGWRDHVNSFATVEEADREATKIIGRGDCVGYEWAHVVDLQTGSIVAEYKTDPPPPPVIKKAPGMVVLPTRSSP